MARFDPTEPYTEVHGLPGVAFTQADRLFNPGGVEVTIHRWKDTDGEDHVTPIEVAESLKEPPPPKRVANEVIAVRDLHHHTLAAMLRTYGETYINREQAIAYLEGTME